MAAAEGEEPPRPRSYLGEVDKLRGKYIASSKLKDKAATESVALSLARLEVHARLLAELEATGQLGTDESRTLPACHREARHLRAELGLSGTPDSLTEDEDDGF